MSTAQVLPFNASKPLHEEDSFCTLADGQQICYRDYGQTQDPAVVLLVGLSLQLHYWPSGLIQRLLQAGHRVVVLDNRDIGRSFRHASRPLQMKDLVLGRGRPDGYSLKDMAADVIAVMDHLRIGRAHIAGMSMGGMIAQEVSSHHPDRVLTLCSIFSTTGHKKVGQPSLKGKLRMLRARPKNREEAMAHYLEQALFIAGNGFHIDVNACKDYAGKAWDRGNGARAGAGISRQIGAIYNSGNRSESVSSIKAPTLVIHGDADPLVHPSGGYATANAIKHSRFVLIPGMGHFISEEVSPLMAELLLGNFARA